MSGLVTKYQKLTDTISIPEEWRGHFLKEFLIPLIREVIDASSAGKIIILQVFNQPAILVQRQNRDGMQYFFEKVFTEEIMGLYIIDVIFDTNDKNIETTKRIKLDDYTVNKCHSEYRTAYYLIPIAQPVPITQVQNQLKMCDFNVILLMAAVAIPHLVFLVILLNFQFITE